MISPRAGALTTCVARPDGALLYTSTTPMPSYPEVLTDRLAHWAQHAPDRLFVAKRDHDRVWRGVTYADAWTQVRSIAQALIDRGLSAERPVAILSGNSVEHALLALAGQLAGAPAAAISPAYAAADDFQKLRHVMTTLTPGLVFVQDIAPFRVALTSVVSDDIEICAVAGVLDERKTAAFADLVSVTATADVDARRALIKPDDVAKFLFTSGSTGLPKAVPNTHRMLCANQAQIELRYPEMVETHIPPVLVDWLPWNHTFGGNHNFGLTLYRGGTLYIDDGRPTPGGIEETVRNLREIAPTMYFNVPKGYQELLPRLQADRTLAATFFSRLGLLYYAGASLPASIWHGFPALAEATTGKRLSMMTGLGATETSPSSLDAIHAAETPGEIGIPLAGVEIKLVPNRSKLELRIRGPNVMPGYWRMPEATARAFDEEGFYKIGDAVKFLDPADPDRGLRFDGRIAEDFKLTSGTWVSVGPLRQQLIAHFEPCVRDAVIAGADREDVRVLLIPDADACRDASGLGPDAPVRAACASPALQTFVAERLKSLAAKSTGGSTRIVAAAWLSEPMSIDAGEITDKGSLNGALILERRQELVAALYGSAPVLAYDIVTLESD